MSEDVVKSIEYKRFYAGIQMTGVLVSRPLGRRRSSLEQVRWNLCTNGTTSRGACSSASITDAVESIFGRDFSGLTTAV